MRRASPRQEASAAGPPGGRPSSPPGRRPAQQELSRCAASLLQQSVIRRVALPRSGCAAGLAAAEALDAAAGVHQLLPARVERVAVGADLDVDLCLRGASRELVPARAAHVSLYVVGVDLGLHCVIQDSDGRLVRLRARTRLNQPAIRRQKPPAKRAGSGCLARTWATHSSSGRLPSISRLSAEMTGAST